MDTDPPPPPTPPSSPEAPTPRPPDTPAAQATPASGVTIAVTVAAGLQLLGVVAVVVLRLLDADPGDSLPGVVAMAAVYGLPGVLALLGLRRRWPLLLAAGIASLVLAVLPVSVHTFVFAPAGVVHLVACALWKAPPHGTGRTATVAAVVPTLLVAAFVALLWHEDPICWERHADGSVVVHRDVESVTSGSGSSEADSEVVESGCSSDTVVWWEAATSLALAGVALGVGVGLSRPDR